MMSSLYAGASGMRSHSTGMSVISNNLANVNTIGYKQVSMQYSDLISQFSPTPSSMVTNISQIGAGSTPGSTRTLFSQESFEPGSEATDIGINGIGFFGVAHNGVTQYTRAGNFRFTEDGHLVTPDGWNLLGHAIEDGNEAAAATPIQLDFSTNTENGIGYNNPKATSTLVNYSHLGGVEDSNPGSANPFFSMASGWDGTSQNPLGADQYSYKEAFSFYDANGSLVTGNIYYDQAGVEGGQEAIEFVVGLNPAEDGSALAGTKGAGLLMSGTLSFSSSGQLQNMTAFLPPASGNPGDLEAWTPALLQDGFPAFTVTPIGGQPQTISLDMGLKLSESSSSGLNSAAAAATNPSAIYAKNSSAVHSERSSTTFGESPVSLLQQHDGRAEGWLMGLDIEADGTMIGRYSNGEEEELYRIPLNRFISQDGLRREGNNRFSASVESGTAQEGLAGTENFGTLTPYSLEQSNVDYAREFSTMIVTQRGFQVNSKVITTSDTMLQRALELKR